MTEEQFQSYVYKQLDRLNMRFRFVELMLAALVGTKILGFLDLM